MTEITNTEDLIDSREVIERIAIPWHVSQQTADVTLA